MCLYDIQGVLGGNANIVGRASFGHLEKKVRVSLCLIVNGYRDTAV
jgi:hypothetical protein